MEHPMKERPNTSLTYLDDQILKNCSKMLNYTAADLQAAQEAVLNGTSQRLAAKTHGVPLSTIRDHFLAHEPPSAEKHRENQ